MAQLLVRNLDDEIVKKLKRRAAKKGHSAEEEHRIILQNALKTKESMTMKELLVHGGTDCEFDELEQVVMDRQKDLIPVTSIFNEE